jgi:hypothetical protein
MRWSGTTAAAQLLGLVAWPKGDATMSDTADNSANVTIVERINGWWLEEERDGGQRQLHGPYPDEATAQSAATA